MASSPRQRSLLSWASFQRPFPISNRGNPSPPPPAATQASSWDKPGPWGGWCPTYTGARPPVGRQQRVSEVAGRSLKVGRGGHTHGMSPPSPPTYAPRPRHPRSPCAEQKHGRSLRALEQKAGDLDPGAYRHENNDRTGSAWGWASGSPSRQTSLSRNLGGTVFSLGVQFRYRSWMEEQA